MEIDLEKLTLRELQKESARALLTQDGTSMVYQNTIKKHTIIVNYGYGFWKIILKSTDSKDRPSRESYFFQKN